MKYLLALLFALAPAARAVEIIPPQNVTIVFGGNDPTKLPLAGGNESGPVTFTDGGGSFQGAIAASSDSATGGLLIQAEVGNIGAGVINLSANGSQQIAIVFSTSPTINPPTAPTIIYNAFDNILTMGLNDAGFFQADSASSSLKLNGSNNAVSVSASGVDIGEGVVTVSGTTTNLNATTTRLNGITHLPFSANQVLCTNASGNLAVCTSAVDGGGNCTCP